MKPRVAPERGVFLIGFMASGKSAVGKVLAQRLGRPFVDTDRAIERAAGASVPRLFSTRGEAAFRNLEARAVAAAARTPGAVVALGGGAVLNPANVAAARRAGVLVYLQVPGSRLWARARAQGLTRRPLLAAATPAASRAKLERLLAARRPLYRRAAHLVVRGAAPIAAVAARIERRLRSRP